ncbi:hypothetical protein MMC30_007481 [Trapelia coarctata]|nr:hypothetical protein [Trapelia coarctata]
MPNMLLPILGTAVVTFCFAIALMFFFAHTKQAIPFLPQKSGPAKKPTAAGDVPKPKYPDLYRVVGIPSTYDKEATGLLLRSILGCHESSLVIHSLGDDPQRKPDKVAVFTLAGGSEHLPGRGRRWTFPIPKDSLSKEEVYPVKRQILIDDHFEGFTPMNSIKDHKDHKVE